MLVPIVGAPPSWTRSFGSARRRFEACLVHPDGQRLFAAEHDGAVGVFELGSGQAMPRLETLLSTWELEEARGVELALHPNGRWLFSTVAITDCGDITHAWDLETGALLDRYTYPRGFGHPVGDHEMVSAHGTSLTLWDLATGATVRTVERADLSWSVYGAIHDHVLVRAADRFEVWDLRAGRQLWSEPALAAAIHGDLIAIASPGQLVFRRSTGAVVRELAVPVIDCVELALAGDTAVFLTPHDNVIVDLESGEVRGRFAREGGPPTIAVCGELQTWSWATGATVWSSATGTCRLRASVQLALAPDGARAYGCDGARIREWLVDGRDLRAANPGWFDVAVSTLPDALLGRSFDHAIHVVGHDGRPHHRWGPAPPGELAGARLVEVTGEARIIDATTGLASYAIPGPTAIALSRTGELLAGATREGVSIWRLGDTAAERLATVRARSPKARPIAVEGTRVALAHATSIELWRITPPLRLHTFRSITPATSAAFDPALRWLVSGHEDGAVLIRDLAERRHHATLQAERLSISGVAIQGTRVAVWAWHALTIWDVGAPATPIATWNDAGVHRAIWLDGETLACATGRGLVVLRLAA